MRVLVLGGAGMMAQAIVRDLIESDLVEEVVLGDFDPAGLRTMVKRLDSEKLKPLRLDITAGNFKSRVSKARVDVLVNSAWYEYNVRVMRTAIQCGSDYLDLGGLYHTTLEQLKFESLARKKGVTCILGMGSSPGTMNVMGKYASQEFDTVERMALRCGDRFLESASFSMPYSVKTVIDEFTEPPIILRGGKLVQASPLTGREEFDLPPPVGRVSGYCTLHSELATMPKNIGKGIKDMDFIVAYDPAFTSTVTSLVKMGLADKKPTRISDAKIVPYDFLLKMIRRLPRGVRDPVDAEVLRVEADGVKDGRKRRVRIDCQAGYHERWGLSAGTVNTGVPASMIAQWLAQGRLNKTGVMAPEECIEPDLYFRELNSRERGIEFYEGVDGGRFKSLSN